MAREKKPLSEYTPRIETLEDGSLKNRRLERYALFLADDIDRPDAWNIADNKPTGTQINYSYQKRVNEDGAFTQRLRDLCAEKEELMAQDPYGPLIWQARQAYRHSVAKDDHKEMRANTELQMKLLDLQRGKSPAGPTPDQIPRGPGKPPTDVPQITKPSQFKAHLRAMGVKTPADLADSDAA